MKTVASAIEHCRNCNAVIEDNYCSHCGQKKYKRIDRKYVIDEIQYTFLHANKGLLYSLKNILKNPGGTAKEYIEGNRVNHYKPILLTFVLSGVSTFLTYRVLGLNDIMGAYYAQQHVNTKVTGSIMTFMASYYSMIMVLLIPFFALATKISFRKCGNNYYEHIVINAYILSYYTMVFSIIVVPILFLFRHSSPTLFFTLTQFSLLLLPLILVWFFKAFYPGKSMKSIVWNVLSTILLVLVGYVLVMLMVVIGFLVYFYLSGANPTALSQP